jgi:6-phosphofructokinase 1
LDQPCEFYLLQPFDVRYFFYIGGNDSAETAHIINEESKKQGYEMRCFHIPKTIDNDLRVTDHCPGYGSACRFVAHGFQVRARSREP